MNQEAQNNQLNNILAKCWTDASFKQNLLADPVAALKAEGVEIPTGYTVRVLENTDKLINYVLPLNPNVELSDSELEAVAGAGDLYKARDRLKDNFLRESRARGFKC